MGNHEEEKRCPACGRGFSCGARVGRCWCMALPPLEHSPPYRDCLCPDCLRAWSAAEAGGQGQDGVPVAPGKAAGSGGVEV